MAESHVVSGLVNRRAEVSGELIQLRMRIFDLEHQLKTLDQAILIFDPNYSPESIPPKRLRQRKRFFARGELVKLVYQALRASGGPLTLLELSQKIAEARGIEEDLRDRVRHTLKEQARSGMLVRDGSDEENGAPLWRIADQAASAGRKGLLTPLRP